MRALSALFCALIAIGCAKKVSPLFTKGVYPLAFGPNDFPRHPKTNALMTSSADCATCHKTVFENWQKSRHRVSFSNELYQESHAREPSPWCVNCHAPLRQIDAEKKTHLGDEGISCIVCHVREGEILTPRRVEGGAHRYRVRTELADERFCEGCHDFNFPAAASAMSDGKNFHYTDQPMQSTVAEYRASAFYGRVSCQGCHLFSQTKDSHLFPGGHALDRLARDLQLEVTRVDARQISLRIFAQGIGHAFPTGDLFRTLRIKLSDTGSRYASEVELRHYFEANSQSEIARGGALKRRTHEELLPPPGTDYISMREFIIEWPHSSRELAAELSMDYLSRETALTTRLPASLTRPRIKRQRFQLKPMPPAIPAEG